LLRRGKRLQSREEVRFVYLRGKQGGLEHPKPCCRGGGSPTPLHAGKERYRREKGWNALILATFTGENRKREKENRGCSVSFSEPTKEGRRSVRISSLQEGGKILRRRLLRKGEVRAFKI